MSLANDAIAVRPLVESDVPAVAALLAAQLREHEIPVRQERLVTALKGILSHGEQGIVLVAARASRHMGVAYVSFARPLEHDGEVAWLEELYVSPESRELGVGTRLLREVVARAEARGCLSVELEVKRGHERVLSLYGREGFQDLGRKHLAKPLKGWDWQ